MVQVTRQPFDDDPILPNQENNPPNQPPPTSHPVSQQTPHPVSQPTSQENPSPTSQSANQADGMGAFLQRKSSYADEAYKNIASCMVADPLVIENPEVALNLFETAVKVNNVHLGKQCVAILNTLMTKPESKGILLKILTKISKFQKNSEPDPNDYEPSAPPIVENEDERTEDWVHELIDTLRHNCLLEIDKYGDYILKQKEIIDLTYSDLHAITTRDTLKVSNELVVYSAIMRWGMQECKRRTLQTQLINIKAVLRDLVYAPRYGLMTKRDFLHRTIDGVKGPDRSGILDETETERILEYIKKREKGGKKKSLEELPFKGSRERKPGNGKPRGLSLDGQSTSRCDSTCDKIIINMLTCFSAVFD